MNTKKYIDKKMLLSKEAQKEKARIADKAVYSLTEEYISLPNLPIGDIVIDKIGIYNYDFAKGDSGDAIKYGIFNKLDIHEYPEGKNPDLDYMPNDNVSPVVIIDDNGNKYKVNYLLWFPLSDIQNGILYKQSIAGVRVFPVKATICENHQWITTLMNLVGRNRRDR
jgi:hypothetical protein